MVTPPNYKWQRPPGTGYIPPAQAPQLHGADPYGQMMDLGTPSGGAPVPLSSPLGGASLDPSALRMDDYKRQEELGKYLMESAGSGDVGSAWEGIGRLGKMLSGSYVQKKAGEKTNKAETDRARFLGEVLQDPNADAQSVLNRLMSSGVPEWQQTALNMQLQEKLAKPTIEEFDTSKGLIKKNSDGTFEIVREGTPDVDIKPVGGEDGNLYHGRFTKSGEYLGMVTDQNGNPVRSNDTSTTVHVSPTAILELGGQNTELMRELGLPAPPENKVWQADPTSPVGARLIDIPGSEDWNEAQDNNRLRKDSILWNLSDKGEAGLNIQRLLDSGYISRDSTGTMYAQLMSNVWGSDAAQVKAMLGPVEAAIGFDRLQTMRDMSKTGGALGAVSERELDLLKSSWEALSQALSPEEFISSLNQIQDRLKTFSQRAAAAYQRDVQTGIYPPDPDIEDAIRIYLGDGSGGGGGDAAQTGSTPVISITRE